MSQTYQLIIIGGGPAGLTAAVYARRSQLNTLVISAQPGGTIGRAHQVQNFPSHIEIKGIELAQKMIEQAEHWQAEIKLAEVASIKKENGLFLVQTDDNQIHQAEALLLALGTQKKKLNLPNEDKFLGRGLSYCALCDGHFFKNKKVIVCGSGDAAATTAIYLSDLAETVYLVARKDTLKCCPSWEKVLKERKNITILYRNQIEELKGEKQLESVKLKNPHQEKNELSVNGLFVEIGSMPSSLLAKQLGLKLDKEDYIEVSPGGRTSQAGVWAAGDITDASNKLWQAVTACAEGAIAADDIYRYFQLKD